MTSFLTINFPTSPLPPPPVTTSVSREREVVEQSHSKGVNCSETFHLKGLHQSLSCNLVPCYVIAQQCPRSVLTP